MKILFIIYDNEAAQNPIPMGVCYISSYLRKHGYKDITFYNQDVYHYPEEHLTKYLDENHFDIIGIGFCAGYHQYKKIKSICKAIDKSKDRPFVVLGGHGASGTPEFFLRETGADAVIKGEGEATFLRLVNDPLQSIYRSSPLENIDFEPYYDLLPMEYYLNAKWFTMKSTDRYIPMITSRGCNWNCNFCQRLEKGIRFRSPEAVRDELKKYIRDYGVTFIQFWDELFMYSEERVSELTEAISDLNINYWCTGRLNIVNERILDMLKKSGCVYIDYGIEQFDNRALEMMNKKQTEEQIVKGIELTQKYDIKIGFNIIWGNLGDTRESLWKSTELLKKYNDYGQLRVIRPVTPYPGSPLYETAIKKGLLKDARDFYEKHTNLEKLTVNFTDIPDDEFHKLLSNANKEIIVDYYNHLTDETLKKFHDVYFKGSNFRGARHI